MTHLNHTDALADWHRIRMLHGDAPARDACNERFRVTANAVVFIVRLEWGM